MKYGVITRVADPRTGGNLALGEVYLDPQALGGAFNDYHLPIGEALKNPVLGLFCQTPVFRVGEILVLQGDRDQFTRKPSKWDVDCEEFDNVQAAVTRAVEVTQ